MNRVNGVYERDVAIRMIMISNNDLIIYVVEPDPYTNSNGSAMLGQNQANLDLVIGNRQLRHRPRLQHRRRRRRLAARALHHRRRRPAA